MIPDSARDTIELALERRELDDLIIVSEMFKNPQRPGLSTFLEKVSFHRSK